MLSFINKNKLFLSIFLIFSIITLTVFYTALKPKKSLPVFSPSMVNPEMVDSTVQYVSKYHTISNFEFTNQNGEKITQKDYENKVFVADFFFTTCGTICPKMTTNLVEIQKEFVNNPKVMLLSHSVMPDADEVKILKEYAIKNGVIDSKWNLVTGNKKDIYSMARKSYLAVKLGSPSELYDMVHTENFVLVDTKMRVRGFYDGTNKEDIVKLIEDINFLLEE